MPRAPCISAKNGDSVPGNPRFQNEIEKMMGRGSRRGSLAVLGDLRIIKQWSLFLFFFWLFSGQSLSSGYSRSIVSGLSGKLNSWRSFILRFDNLIVRSGA